MANAKLILIFVVSLFLLTMAKLPVALVAERAPIPSNMSYEGLSGTVWQGEIQRLQFDDWLLTDVQWQLAPLALLTGNAAFDIKFGKARDSQQLSGKGQFSYGISGILANGVTVRLPANNIKQMLPIPMGDIGGRVIATIEQYAKGDALCRELSGDLTWTKAEVDFGGRIALGALSSALSCDNAVIVAAFDGQNRLGLEGVARIESPQAYNFDGYLKPDAELPASLHQGVSMFGKADSKGKYKIKL